MQRPSGTCRISAGSVIFADTDIYTNLSRDSEQAKAHKDAVREAVTKVKAHAATLNIPASLVYIAPPAAASVAAAVQKIRKDVPGARFTFDLSGGSKDLSLALFQISFWIGGGAYYAFEERKGATGPLEKLAVPKIPLREIAANPNYMRILAVLAHPPGKTSLLPGSCPALTSSPSGSPLCAGEEVGGQGECLEDKDRCRYREAGGNTGPSPRGRLPISSK